MTNKELRAQLLIEAADALEESAGKNGLYDRYRNTCYLHNTYKYYPSDDKFTNPKKHANSLDARCIAELKKGGKYNPIKRIINDKKINNLIHDNRVETHMKRDAVDDLLYAKPMSRDRNIHDKINDNAKNPGKYKSKNESVADILMEAAYMLMDDED